MEKLKNTNGITLIALIITIIVMLILVGVTISVALNGGLFTTAQDAATRTIIEAEKEQLLESVVASMGENAKVDFTKLDSSLPTGEWSGKNGIYTSPKENKYRVKEDGTIEYIGKANGGNNGDLEKYILGADGNGRILVGEDGIIDLDNFSFKDDPLTADVDEAETLGVELLIPAYNKDITKFFIYAKYDNKAYKIICDATTYKSEELEVIYEPKGKEGQKTTDEWTILYDNGSTAEAVSPTAMGELRLGYAEGTTDSDTQLSQAIESYNSAITTINNYCKNLEGLPTNSGVRSVGASEETTTTKYSSDNLAKWNSACNGVVLEGDTNFEQDLVRMTYWGVNNVGATYWLASRVVYGSSDSVQFSVNFIRETGGIDFGDYFLCNIDSSGNANGKSNSLAVRPIITIENQ